MDGLEAVEVRLSEVNENKDFRCDSSFWTTTIQKNETLNYEKIGNLLVSSQYGISINMNEDGIGVPIYRMNEINNMLCVNSVDKYAEVTVDEMMTFKLNNKDVLFNRTNSFEWVGRTGVFYGNSNAPFIFASYLVRFVPKNDRILPEYLAAFLSCKYGVKAVKGRSRQSINQTNVNPEEVKEIEIPLIGLAIQRKIEKCFEIANINIVSAEKQYKSAEMLLMSYLELENHMLNPSGIAVKTLSQSFGASGRLDSEYYQPKYEEIEKLINAQDTVLSVCKLHDSNFVPENKAEYKYIELSNIGKNGEILDVEQSLGEELPTRARRIVKQGQVIVSSIEGSLSSCALISDDYDNALCSTGFYIVSSETVNSETLLTIFKSSVIQPLMKKRCSGTILTAMNKDEFLSLPIPSVNSVTQQEIAEKIQQSFALRKKSAELLELAKTAVEVAIEQGEEKALAMLEEVTL